MNEPAPISGSGLEGSGMSMLALRGPETPLETRFMKHVRTMSKFPQPATIGPGLSWVQQLFLLLTKGRFLPVK
ncbi:MAG: hypothetical protein AMXMBFR84_35960 [Candidatus Hydrogenedentota bacterium]